MNIGNTVVESWIIDISQLSQEGGELLGSLFNLMGDYDQWILVTDLLNIFNTGHSKVFFEFVTLSWKCNEH